MRIILWLAISILLNTNISIGQSVPFIFRDQKIINSFSTATLPARTLDFRISHRFGDMFGNTGGWKAFYGLENARDISIGFDYGINDRLMIGINRTKGSGQGLRMLINTYFKYKLAGQRQLVENPTAVSFVAMTSISTMPKTEGITAISNFPKFIHRFMHHFQFVVAKRFSDGISLQISTGYTHLNFVDTDDVNFLLNVGLAGRFQFSKTFALILEGNWPIRFEDVEKNYKNPIGGGVEWETGGGHVFQIILTNAGGLAETDYIPNTISDWGDGEFRLGFTISRKFKL